MITLVLGGTRSGKSAVAERIAAASGAAVIYVATGTVDDPEMAVRVAAHRARRPGHWGTVECGPEIGLIDAVGEIRSEHTVLIDSLAAWVAGADGFSVDADRLCTVLSARSGHCVVVSDEVGMGVHPSTEPGRRFRDALGSVNQTVASAADEALLVVAGRVLRLDAR